MHNSIPPHAEDLAQGPICFLASSLKFNYLLPWVAACWKQIMDLRKGLMDLKYNLAQTRLLRDRSPLPITTLEVIKDSPEFVTLASSEHLQPSVVFYLKGTLCTGINHGFNVD